MALLGSIGVVTCGCKNGVSGTGEACEVHELRLEVADFLAFLLCASWSLSFASAKTICASGFPCFLMVRKKGRISLALGMTDRCARPCPARSFLTRRCPRRPSRCRRLQPFLRESARNTVTGCRDEATIGMPSGDGAEEDFVGAGDEERHAVDGFLELDAHIGVELRLINCGT